MEKINKLDVFIDIFLSYNSALKQDDVTSEVRIYAILFLQMKRSLTAMVLLGLVILLAYFG